MKVDKNVLSIIRSIGIPNIIEGKFFPHETTINLIDLAKLNKVLLLYLESLVKVWGEVEYTCAREYLEEQLLKLREQQARMTSLITFIAGLFESEKIEYTFFKTIKPFPHTPNDADILLASTSDLKNAYKALKSEGWIPLNKERYGITMYNRIYGLNADLHLEPMVSNLLYLDKSLLFQHAIEKEINDYRIRTLDDCAELIAVAAHSGYKEHIFTLNDFYTIIMLAENVRQKDLSELVANTKSRVIVMMQLTLTSSLVKAAFSKINLKLNCLLECLGNSRIVNILSFKKKVLKMPHKYPRLSIAFTLAEKITNDNHSRSSLIRAIKESMSTSQLRNLLFHFSRKSY